MKAGCWIDDKGVFAVADGGVCFFAAAEEDAGFLVAAEEGTGL